MYEFYRMSISDEYCNNMATISINDSFTFNDSSAFRDSLNKAVAKKIEVLNINLSRLDFIDSSGLGMLMVTDKECKKHEIKLQLSSPSGDVKRILELTRLYERFDIRG